MPYLNCARRIMALTVVLVSCSHAQAALAQDEEAGGTAAAPRIWTNQADLGMVITGGNSRNNTISFDDHLRGKWDKSQLTVRLGAYRQTSDDITRIAFGSPDGFTPGEISLEELDQLRVYVNSAYRRDISARFFWTGGAGWDRDVDAGIESRIVGFAGVGNKWSDRDDLQFSTEYTFAYEYRTDEIPDPELGKSRPSIRLAWNYLNNLFGKDTTVLTNNMDFFFNLKKSSAYRFINTTALTLGMSSLLSLRTSLEFRYDNFPGLETVDLWDSDPNTNPGAGIIGSVNIRKHKLDTLFKLTLVFNM